ncbi:MAG: hypothetical protein AAF612_05590 [Planctomycetota bacterium]
MNPRDGRTRTLTRLALVCCLMWSAVGAAPADAQGDAGLPFVGVVTPAEVEARAGASDVFYPTAVLRQGDRVEVHQIFYGWVKVVPPEGSYSFVSKGFVDPIGDGTVGEVSRPRVEVLAGALSGLAADSYRSQVVLSEGEQVRILPADPGQRSDFYKIVPPRGAFVFLPPNSVRRAPDAVAPTTPEPEPQVVEAPVVQADPEPAPEIVAQPEPEPQLAVETEPQVVEAPVADPEPEVVVVEAPAPVAVNPEAEIVAAPTVEPVAPPESPAVSSALRDVEERMLPYFVAPVENQPFDEMQSAYEAVRKDESLTRKDKLIVERRLLAIENNRRVLASLQRIDQAKAAVGEASTAPLPDPADRPSAYAAVGELAVSGVYNGARLPRLFRVVEPNSQRTIAYVQPGPAVRAERVVGKLVGVVGQPAYDRALRIEIIAPTRLDLLEAQSGTATVAAE